MSDSSKREPAADSKPLDEVRKEHIQTVLEQAQGDLEKSADILGVSARKLRTWMSDLSIKPWRIRKGDARTFELLFNYEISRSERHGRCVSLLMVGSGNGPVNVHDILQPALRASDAAFTTEQGLAIVMGDTDIPAVGLAVERFKGLYNGSIDLRYGAASFPRDPKEAQELIAKASKRLGDARRAEAGAVVCEG